MARPRSILLKESLATARNGLLHFTCSYGASKNEKKSILITFCSSQDTPRMGHVPQFTMICKEFTNNVHADNLPSSRELPRLFVCGYQRALSWSLLASGSLGLTSHININKVAKDFATSKLGTLYCVSSLIFGA